MTIEFNIPLLKKLRITILSRLLVGSSTSTSTSTSTASTASTTTTTTYYYYDGTTLLLLVLLRYLIYSFIGSCWSEY